MRVVVAAVIEREDRRLLIAQRRRQGTLPLKWEFPGGKVERDETPENALARELREELGVTMQTAIEIGRQRHKYAADDEVLEIRFYAVAIAERNIVPRAFERVTWALPKQLRDYDFLTANQELIAELATGRIKPGEILAAR